MNKKLKIIVCPFFILLFFLNWQPISFSQEISKPVTYSAQFKPLGDGIDWEGSVPDDFDAVHLSFKFNINPGTVESEINANIIFDPDNQTLSVQPRIITDLSNVYAGKFGYSAGVLLSGEIIFDFVLPIPFFPDIPIYHAHPIPGFPQINEGWNDETFFDSLLLNESVEVEGGVRKIVSVDITVVEIAELLAIVLSQGSLPQRIADKAGDIIKEYIGDGGIRLNGGLKNKFTLSGAGIFADGQLITDEDQTVSTPGLNPSLDSYSIHSSYEERFSVELNFVISSDVFFNFAPFDIELWSYEKEILEVPIPIVPKTEINTFDFATTPDTITFPVRSSNDAVVNRAPEASGTISPQTVRIGDAHTIIDISDKFTDPDDDTLAYTVETSNPGVLTLQRVGSEITLLPWRAGSATITVTATDPDGLEATQTFSVTVLPSTPTTVNRAPVAEGSIGEQSLYVSSFSTTIDVSDNFRDPDGDTLTYSATSSNTRVVTAEYIDNSRIRITPEANGSATVTVTASDGSFTAKQTFSVTVSTLLIRPNRAPKPEGTISARTMTVGDASTTIDISDYFRDPDGDTLTYTVTSDDADVVSVQRTGTSSVRLTPEGDGSATVTVTASDGSQSVTQTFSVTVNPSTVDTSDSPDLVVEDISVNYETGYPGENFKVSVTVRNAGNRGASNTTLRYYLSSDSTYSTDDEEIEDDSVGSLVSGETSRESAYLDAPNEPGNYYFIARVARVGHERNTSNNYASIKITVLPPATPDLVVSLSASKSLVDPNDRFRLNAVVRNQGDEDAPDSTTLRYYQSSDPTFSPDDEEIGTDSVRRLRDGGSGGSDKENYNHRAPEKPGTYYYFACVDSVEGEGNTDNNCSNVVTVNVRGSDLAIDSVSVDYLSSRYTTVRPDGIFELYVTVLNRGTDNTWSDTTLRYYVSSDSTLSADDTEVATDMIYSLDVNETSDESSDWLRPPYKAGVFYCFVCVDEVEDETDTDNNCYGPIKLTVRNVAPNKQGEIAAQMLNVGTPLPLDASEYFVDANNDTLTYSVSSSDTNIATVTTPNNVVTITPKHAGNATITVTASDGEFTATQTITITVVSEETWMPDARLRAAVRAALGLQPNDVLTQQAMAGLTTLNANHKAIKSLIGLEHASNLTALNLHQNQISDISALNGLTKLTNLDLGRNQISDITPLEKLTTLTNLNLTYNQVRNTTSLQNLTKLTWLDLHQNGSSNITPLQGLTELIHLDLGRNGITDITSLKSLTKLTYLDLSFNGIGNITPLQNLTALTSLNLRYAQIVDITPLQSLTALTFLHLGTNKIVDIEPLKNLIALTNLYLISNQIKDVMPLENLAALRFLYLKYNPIADFAPLRNLKTKNPAMSIDIDISEVSNNAPVAIGTISARTLAVNDSAIVIDVSSNFNDSDNDTVTYTANSSNTSVVSVNVSGSQITITPIGVGTATITITANDGELTATQTISITVTAAPVVNRAPFTVGAISSRTLTEGDSSIQIDVSGNFQDPDNDTLTYSVNSNNTSVATASVSGSQVTITPVAAGSATITVAASDGELTATQTIAISVTNVPAANQSPVPVSTIPVQNFTTDDDAKTLPMELYFNDPENNALTYIATSDNTTVATVSITGNQLTITPVNAGSATITVVASDGEFTATQLISVSVTTPVAEAAWIPDANLRAAVLSTLGLQSGVALTQEAMTRLTRLNASNRQISDLTGLERATNLRQLYLNGNQFSDISALQNLTALTTLAIENNQVSDVTPLNQLTALTNLDVSHNQISDIGAFQNLTALTSLDLTTNQINNVTPLQNLSTLTSIHLGTNQINSITPLGSLTALTFLSLSRNSISDISSLADLTNLGHLSIGYNQISDITSIQNLTQLTALYFHDNQISDITPLQNLTNLTNLGLQRNQISDVTSLESLTSLRTLSLIGNPISDLSPLSRLKLQNPNVAIDISIPEIENTVVAVGTIPSQTLTTGGTTRSINVAQYFNVSPDSIVLTYDATSDNTAVATVSVSGSVVTITQVAAGSAIVTVEANHDTLTATQRISVSVITDVTEETWMPDPILRSAVRSALSLQEDDDLTQQAMESLTRLVAQQKQIGDLTGLEYAANLKTLYLWDNQISNLSPLEDLTSLTQLNLSDNQISDISSLEDLTALTWLVASDNEISDLTPLEDLTALGCVYISLAFYQY